MSQLKSVTKSILIGGAAGGIISLIPIINLLNLLFMFWMGFGGGLCVYLLFRENKSAKITAADALLSGAASGALGCVIFGAVSYIVFANIPPGKIERIIEIFQHFFPANGGGDITPEMQGNDLKTLFLIVTGLLLLFSVIMGALGGLTARGIFKGKENG